MGAGGIDWSAPSLPAKRVCQNSGVVEGLHEGAGRAGQSRAVVSALQYGNKTRKRKFPGNASQLCRGPGVILVCQAKTSQRIIRVRVKTGRDQDQGRFGPAQRRDDLRLEGPAPGLAVRAFGQRNVDDIAIEAGLPGTARPRIQRGLVQGDEVDALIGLGHESGREAGTRAVLEGVAFALADCADALAACGTTLDSVIAVGGGARSRYWLEAIATALGTPVAVPAAGDYGAAFGAARLGAMAAGADASFITPPAVDETIEPRADLAGAFADAHARYKATYAALKELS